MARILIEVGPLSSERTFDNVKAARTLGALADSIEFPNTPVGIPSPYPDPLTEQERLDLILDWIVQAIRRESLQHEVIKLNQSHDEEREALKGVLI